jgi:hypothetical protein
MNTTTQHVYDCRIGAEYYDCPMTVIENAKKGEQRWFLARNDIAEMIRNARNNGATNDEVLTWMTCSRLVPAKTK